VQHARALVRQQGQLHEVEARLAALDVADKLRAGLPPRSPARLPLEPWAEMARYAQRAPYLGRGKLPGSYQSCDLARSGVEFSVGVQEGAEPAVDHAGAESSRRLSTATGSRPQKRRLRRLATVEKNLHACAAGRGSLVECRGTLPAQGRNDTFDMLASAELVDAMIDAAARVGRAY
jgi:hypothetical protein